MGRGAEREAAEPEEAEREEAADDRWLVSHWTSVLRGLVVAAMCGLLLALFLNVGDRDAGEMLVAFGFVSVALLALGLRGDVASRIGASIESLKIGAGGLEFTRVLRQAVDERDADAERDGVADDLDILDVRGKLEAQLAYIAKHIVGTPERNAFVTFGSLRNDGLLAPEKARAALLVASLGPSDVPRLSEADREAADQLVAGILIHVMRRQAMKTLKRVKEESGVKGLTITVDDGRDPDLFLLRDETVLVCVAPVWTNVVPCDTVDRTRGRLGGGDLPKLIALPNGPKLPSGQPDLVWLADLERRVMELVERHVAASAGAGS